MINKKHLDDYEIITTKDGNGGEATQMVYRGDHFEAIFQKGSLSSYRMSLFFTLLLILALHISAGFINNPGMRHFLVAIPYVASFLPLYYLAAGVYDLPKEQTIYHRNQVDRTFKRIQTAEIFLMVYFSTGLTGEIIFILFNAAPKHIHLEFGYLALEISAAILTGMLLLNQKKITIKKLEI